MKNRVVITGLGAITPLGSTVEAFWDGLSHGRSGVRLISQFDATHYQTRIAGEVPDFDPTLYLSDRKELRRLARFSQFAVAASKQAIQDAGLAGAVAPERLGVFIGCGMGGMAVIEEQLGNLINKGPDRVSPFTVPMMIPNMAGGNVAIAIGAKGPNECAVTACASGSHAIGDAFRVLQQGLADAMVAGGTESVITPLSISAFSSAKTLSTRNDSPEKASRPFDKDRDGFVMGEGAGVLILETLDHAQARGARIYAEIAGYGMTADAYHMTAPAPGAEGCARAMALALQDAGLRPESVDYINAHGTSTALNDKLETEAVKTVFGAHAHKLAISSIKSMTGHLLGAAGGVEAVATTLSLIHGILPPTLNLEHPDEGLDLDFVPQFARKQDISVALSNNMGFGGHNASLVFKKFET